VTGAALTHAELAVKLVVDGALRIAQGKTPAEMPVKALPLTDEEKARADANPEALVVFYPAGDTGVFMQMHGNHVRVWYTGAETDGAVALLEKAIHKAHPNATFKDEQPHLTAHGMNARLYRVPIDDTHYLAVETTFPIDKRVRQQFIVRVHALEQK
jgi:hypothetical protein